MKDEAESLFEEIRPREARPELRSRVLSAVSRELSKATVASVCCAPSWERRIGTLSAVALVVGAALHLWAIHSTEQRLADLAGPRPVPRKVTEMVEIVESVTGPGTGGWVQQRMGKAWRPCSVPVPHQMPDWEQLINELEFNPEVEVFGEAKRKVQPREKAQEVPHQRPDRAVFDDRPPADHQRHFRHHTRQTA